VSRKVFSTRIGSERLGDTNDAMERNFGLEQKDWDTSILKDVQQI
jgi:hypothetical protein